MTGLPRLGRWIPASAADGGQLKIAQFCPSNNATLAALACRMCGVRDSALLDSSSARDSTTQIASPPCLIAGLAPAPTATLAEAAEQALEAFARKWDGRFPTISKSWQANWQRVIPFFAYPPEIRKVIYTTNTIESINASLRKVTRKRGAFPNPDSVRKVLYLAIRKASARWGGRSRTGRRR